MSDDDRQSIKQAELNDIEGWYYSDAVRVERRLHPGLAKRTIFHDPRGFDRL